MALTNFPNGVSSFGFPLIGAGPVISTGSVFFVNSATGRDASGSGSSPDTPFASIDYAVGRCTANAGDIIFAMPGHAEAVIAAAGLDLDVAGISIIGLGNGTNRPTITLSTSTAADIDIDAANITLANVRIVTGIAALVQMLDVNAANFTLHNCEVIQSVGSFTCLDAVVTAAGASNLTISQCKWSGDVDGPDTAIDIIGTPDGIVIEGNSFFGQYDEATIHNATSNVATNLTLKDNYIENSDASAQAVDLDSAVTGVASGNRFDTPNIDPTGAASVDMGALRLFENYATDSADGNAVLHPAAIT